MNNAHYTVGKVNFDIDALELVKVSDCSVKFTLIDIGDVVIHCGSKTELIIDHAQHMLMFANRTSREDVQINQHNDCTDMTITSTSRVRATIHVALGTEIVVTPRECPVLHATHCESPDPYDFKNLSTLSN